MNVSEPLVHVEDLTVSYSSRGGLLGRGRRDVRVLQGIDLELYAGETLGIVGESGCGKSTLGRSLLRLVPAGGRVWFEGQDILALGKRELRTLRQRAQIVFQNPFSALNPRLAVVDLVAEPLRAHTALDGRALRARVSALLVEVGLGDEYLRRHPHELSGGQAQRVVLARALALQPRFLVLDEPTSALDVSVQAQIINLLVRLQREHGLTYLFISHDLSVVQHISDRIGVMYLGEIVELGPTGDVFDSPQHPYTQALLSSTPLPIPGKERPRVLLRGTVPALSDPPAGCRFHTRCPQVIDMCRSRVPVMQQVGEQRAACHLVREL